MYVGPHRALVLLLLEYNAMVIGSGDKGVDRTKYSSQR